MKILHIITRLDSSGSSDIAIQTTLDMTKRGHDVYIIGGYTIDTQRVLSLVNPEKVFFIDEMKKDIQPYNEIKALCKLCSLINKINPDIIHTHSAKAGVLGRWAAWLVNLKNKITKKHHKIFMVHMPHGHVFYGYYSQFVSDILKLIEKLTTHITDKIITLTNIEAETYTLLGIAPVSKLTTIPNGIDLDIYNVSKSYKKPQDLENVKGNIITCIVRLEHVKGQRYLLDAMPFILNSFPDTTLLIVGSGPDRKKLEHQAYMLNIRKKVLFFGDRTDIPEILKYSTLLVLPSLNEGLGLALLRAQAMGVPVVATKVGGIPEVVLDGKSGVLVPPASPQILAQNIINLLSNPDKMKTMSKTAAEWVTESINGKPRFSDKQMLDRLEQLYIESAQQAKAVQK